MLGCTHSRGESGNEEPIALHLPPHSKIQGLICRTHQFSLLCFLSQQAVPGLAQEEESELSKSLYSLGNLSNPPTQINTEETRKWPPVSLAPNNTKYFKLEHRELMRKYKSMAEALPISNKEKQIPLHC